MASPGPFRAVSLDLWFTTLYYVNEADRLWKEDRLRVLGRILRPAAGRRLDRSVVEAALEAVHSRLAENGSDPILVDPGTLVREYAAELGAEVTISAEEAGRLYSFAGLDDHPPLVNPELPDVLRALAQRKIPVVAITNTARRAESWREFFRVRANLAFRHVITSCEVGRAKPDPGIFLEAARRLDVAPSEVLHVGDRWELDVEGARRAGLGAALYRGLWPYYPSGMYPETDPALLEDPDVGTIDRLDGVLSADLRSDRE